MFKSIKLTETLDCFFKNQKFEFKPITLLVGDQGSGKSTLLSYLSMITKNPNDRSFQVMSDDTKQNGTFIMDMEKNNPRHETPNANSPAAYKNTFMSHFQSHGEVLLPVLNVLDKLTDTIILLDEPETALSLRSQFKMIDCFKRALERNNQIIIATHNLLFMEAFPESVLSLEHGKYITPKLFLKAQQKESDFKEKRNDKMIKKTKCSMGNECKCAMKTSFYDNRCENYIGRGGKKNKNPQGIKGVHY